MLEEAEKRDHRRLGREMNLFHMQEEAAGSVFWHPKGWTLYRTVERYMRRRLEAAGYLEVKTPQLIDRSLWEASGHWEKFHEHMFIAESEERALAVKPMNCPGHVQILKFSDRPAVRAGDDATWDKAEKALKDAVEEAGLEYTLNPGEGAFYGPKLEFVLRDAIGRDWQCGTFQVDFVLPERLGASYVGEDGEKHRPVMLHRAILGSFERFLAILIEQYAGRFPLWLAPVQVVVASITSDANDYGEEVAAALRAAGLRTETDLRNEKINYKVREHSLAKVPAIAVVGRREAEEGKVALRRLGSKEQEVLALGEAVDRIKAEAAGPQATAVRER